MYNEHITGRALYNVLDRGPLKIWLICPIPCQNLLLRMLSTCLFLDISTDSDVFVKTGNYNNVSS